MLQQSIAFSLWILKFFRDLCINPSDLKYNFNQTTIFDVNNDNASKSHENCLSWGCEFRINKQKLRLSINNNFLIHLFAKSPQ